MIVIKDWKRLYEPTKHDSRRDGPLKYVQWRVHVDATGDYRRLAMQAGPDLPAALGVFGKLLEMAGNEPRSRRDGTVYDDHHEPATVSQVAFLAMFDESVVSRCVEHLAAVGWVSCGDPATCGDIPRHAATSCCLTGRGTGRGMETETETGTETEKDPDPVEDSGTSESESNPDSPASSLLPPACDHPPAETGHRGIIESAILALVKQFDVRVSDQSDTTPRAVQASKDLSCFRGLCHAVITEPMIDDARRQRDQLMTVAREVMGRRPEKRIRAFVALCRERFDGYAAYCAKRNGSYKRPLVEHDRGPP